VDDLTAEWRDRYGPFPESVRSLILLAKIRSLFKRLGITRLDGGEGDSLVLHFAPREGLDRLPAFLDGKKCVYAAETDLKLRMEIWARNPAQRLARLKRILQEFHESDSRVGSIQ
jgi:transcription-repair coupling factor (superfamily II helicase)